MNLLVPLLVLVVVSYAGAARNYLGDKTNSNKRALLEGNYGDKRALLASSLASASPGIEYAPTKELLSDKSPSQQIYASASPLQLSKISDLLSGQGLPFQTAIASQLYSPISAYQPRLGSPTTFLPAPTASPAFSFQPNPYNLQYFDPKQAPATTLSVPPQQLFYQPFFQQQPLINPQPVFQQVPQLYSSPLHFSQNQLPFLPQVYPQAPIQPVYPQPLPIPQGQPGIVYAKENSGQTYQQPAQRDSQNEQAATKTVNNKPAPVAAPQQNYNNQPTGAVSYASFSQSQPKPYNQAQNQQNAQYSNQAQYPAETQQYQAQNHLYQALNQQNSQNQQYLVQNQQYANKQQNQAQNQQYTNQQNQAQNQQYINNQQNQAQNQQYRLQQYQNQQYTQNQQQQNQQYQNQYQQQYQKQQLAQAQVAQNVYQADQSLKQEQQKSQTQQYQVPAQLSNILPKLEPSPANSIASPAKPADVLFRSVQTPNKSAVQQQAFQPLAATKDQNSNLVNYATPTFPPVQYFGKFAQSIFGNQQQIQQ